MLFSVEHGAGVRPCLIIHSGRSPDVLLSYFSFLVASCPACVVVVVASLFNLNILFFLKLYC